MVTGIPSELAEAMVVEDTVLVERYVGKSAYRPIRSRCAVGTVKSLLR
jgi:hypothetical protein